MAETVNCLNCRWKMYAGSMIFSCPFIAGSCAKIPETLDAPDTDVVRVPKIRREDMVIEVRTGRDEDFPRKYTRNGMTMTVREWSEHLGINRNRLQVRLSRGWDFDAAIQQGIDENHLANCKGE